MNASRDGWRAWLRSRPNLYFALTRLRRWLRHLAELLGVARLNDAVQFAKLGAGSAQIDAAPSRRVLMFSFRGWSVHSAWEALIARALQTRGARCEAFICGGPLPISEFNSIHAAPFLACRECVAWPRDLYGHVGVMVRTLVDFHGAAYTEHARAVIAEVQPSGYEEFTYQGLPLGRMVKIPVRWTLRADHIPLHGKSLAIYRDYLIGAVVMVHVGEDLLTAIRPDVVVMLNGLFFAEQILQALALRQQIRVVTYETGWLPNTLVFAHDRPAGLMDIDELWEGWMDTALAPSQDQRLDGYLQDRARGRMGVQNFTFAERRSPADVLRALRLDPGRAVAVLFSNLFWDTAVQDRDVVFAGLKDWLRSTIDYFAARPEHQLIIRSHPAEVQVPLMKSRERVQDFIAREFPALPANVRLVPSDDPMNSYDLIEASDLGLVYASTTGLEMALAGKPVVVAGRVHYRGKGFTLDATDRNDYAAKIAQSFGRRLSPQQVALARRYAYLLFFRTMIPFRALDVQGERLRLTVDDARDLAPERDAAMDIICRGILDGTPFCLLDDTRVRKPGL